MNRSQGNWARLRAEQDRERRAAGYLEAVRSRGHLRPRVHHRSPFPWRAACIGMAGAAATAAAFVLVPALRATRELTFVEDVAAVPAGSGDAFARPGETESVLSFSDGTRVRLASGAHARVDRVAARGARVILERGSAEVSVVHREGTRWTFDAGPFEVAVVGTRFDLSWNPADESFQLALHEGRVVVSGGCLGEPRALTSQRKMRITCGVHEHIEESNVEEGDARRPPPSTSASVDTVAPAEATATLDGAAPVTASRDAAAARSGSGGGTLPSTPDWHELARGGRYAEALGSVERAGFAETCGRATGKELLDLGDVARLAGNAPRAREAYLAARAKLTAGGRSAYGLGLTEFECDHDFRAAARWFQTYLDEQPAGELRREAAARLMQAWQSTGDRAAASAAAARYLREFPNGPDSGAARRLAAP